MIKVSVIMGIYNTSKEYLKITIDYSLHYKFNVK